ncbi:hypothetical protein EYB26_009902 [Talaromyces marneffei]|uniref:uncharacterized protein n=1 Tax=Talaromyces marneffei TaxID=37727 RepID=UPI0012A9CF0D|nr:uncharacterized protein EYB26_009902 [Talaromyces marneffei]QGA22187.1 hypothetical protein EYB26_009902 [Talaromyces marneffei]
MGAFKTLCLLGVVLNTVCAIAAVSSNTLTIYQSSDLVNTTASAACQQALASNVTCYRGLPAAITRTTSWSSDALSMICDDACTTSLNNWVSSVNNNCGATTQYNISGTLQTAISAGQELLWKQTATCIKDSSGEFCNLVIQGAVSHGDQSVLCSDCALDYLTTVINSPWGQQVMNPVAVESQIQSCSATASYSVTYTATTTSSSGIATASSTVNARCNTTDPETTTYTVMGNETCVNISTAHNVSTPALTALNGLDPGCNYLTAGQLLCLPSVCQTYQVATNDSCTSIIGNLTRVVSTTTFQSWNPAINYLCSNLYTMVGQYLCISPPGTTSMPNYFPLLPATTAAPVPTNAVTTSNTDCGYWYTIQVNDTCQTVASTFGISEDDFYFLNPQLGTNCSSLWLGNSYCVQPVGKILSYAGYNGSSTPYTTLASTINPNATLTANRSTTHFFYSFPPPTTTTSAYNSTAWNLTQNYTLCAQAMAYYNIRGSSDFTDDMYDNAAWFSEYQRVCLVDPGNFPTSAFNTSIVLSTDDPSGPTSTPASTGATATLSSTAPSTSSPTSTPTGGISPNGLCGSANNGWTCAGSTFGTCCSIYGDCGSTSDYCGSNCDPNYGDCPSTSTVTSTTTSTSAISSATSRSNVSPNGLCGASNSGYTCLGSQFGECCSQYGYCGSTSDYCSSANCDSNYGSCSS